MKTRTSYHQPSFSRLPAKARRAKVERREDDKEVEQFAIKPAVELLKKLFLILLLFISSCSSHRMSGYDKEIYSELAQVGVTVSSGKEPYLIKKAFQNEFYLNGDDVYKPKKYDLYFNVSDSIGDWLTHTDSTIIRKNLALTISFSLKEIKTGKTVNSGSAKSLIIFSESPSAWSSYISSEKAYENALNDAMRSVRIQVLLFLAKQHHEVANENKPKKH
jgi:hypothetical protein